MREYLPEVSTENGRFTFYNRPAVIRTSEDLEKMFRDSGVPIVIQREFINKDFDVRDVNVNENTPNGSTGKLNIELN